MNPFTPPPQDPPRSDPAVYRQGDACPFCARAVASLVYGAVPCQRPDEIGYRIGGWARLLPCGHTVDRVKGPGNG
jgi:hypothetical protein